MQLSFAEYVESKNVLRSAAEDAARIKKLYFITKYCKLPILENVDSTSKDYITLKPKDVIEVTWEEFDGNSIARYVCINEGRKLFPTWTINKFNSWVESTCILI